MRRALRSIAAQLAATGALAALFLTVGSPGRSLALLAPEELAPDVVVLVDGLSPRKGKITIVEFRHELLRMVSVDGPGSKPKPGSDRYDRLEAKAIDSLLEIAWTQGEAAELGISVTRGEVSRTVALVRRQSFESAAEYHRFLRVNHYTRHDVFERVELQLLSERLQELIVGKIEREARNPYEERRAFKEFVTDFNEKWRARTICAPRYATERCSNGPPP